MRKLKLQMQVSLDGYVAAADGTSDWMVWNFGPDWTWDQALQQYHTALTETIDTVLLSRKMAEEGFMTHWAGVAKDKESPQSRFAANITGARKIIFSKTWKEAPVAHAELASGTLVEAVNRLKAEAGKDIIVYGGASFARALIKADLVDEYHLVVNPVILGQGLPIFADISERLDLSLISATGYPCGVSVLIYARRRQAPEKRLQ